MPNYIYPYSIDDKTKLKLAQLSKEGWIEIMKRILSDKSVHLNISASKLEPVTRLCEIYNALQTLRLDTFAFQSGLVALLQEYYGKDTMFNEIYLLIKVIDHVRPAGFFDKLRSLAVNPENNNMVRLQTKDNLSIHFYLVNTIMKFDHEGILYSYFFDLLTKNPPPEYFQVAVRYLYMLNSQTYFDEYMNSAFSHIKSGRILDMLLLTIEEYFFYKKDCSLLFYWIQEHRTLLSKGNQTLFTEILQRLAKLFSNDDSNGIYFYYPTKAYLYAYLNQEFSALVFNKLFTKEIRDKPRFFYFLGKRINFIKVTRHDEIGVFYIQFKDADPVEADIAHSQELQSFMDGEKKARNKKSIRDIDVI